LTIRPLFVALSICIPFVTSCETGPDQDPLWVWVPKGRVEATVKPVVHDPQIEEVGLRFSAAVENGDWWEQHTSQHGSVPPHDERMGITPEEYHVIFFQ